MDTTYRRGHSGNQIERIQVRLGELGFDPGPVDGIFGPLTQQAVWKFQEANRVQVDGIVGPETWNLLFSQGAPCESRPASAPSSSPSIFICYRREDSADVVGRVYDRLIQRFGREAVFKDVDSVPLGTNFKEHVSRTIAQCSVLVVFVGRSWLAATGKDGVPRLSQTTDFVRIEVESAIRRGVPIIPVLVHGATMPAESELPPEIGQFAYFNGLSVRADPDFQHDVATLISGIEGVY